MQTNHRPIHNQSVCVFYILEDSLGSSMQSPGGQSVGSVVTRQENRQPTVPLVDFVQQLDDYTPTVSYSDIPQLSEHLWLYFYTPK